ncbi:hypothetical protein FB561_7591 [Kribbella amoyensis]|uniref:Uncharacterized protein n=1 Tax=Kribbella amoyensis TaxID=996641 RepID=A0A561AZG5_9ACTN|nr:hypothetical protein [Kribbella amoyensis]TWD72014.1 hypothetical protein FB561_7591 [Kribbella amoyensis]
MGPTLLVVDHAAFRSAARSLPQADGFDVVELTGDSLRALVFRDP